MLAMGVHPAVVSATSSAMILFTNFASSTIYLVYQLMLVDFALGKYHPASNGAPFHNFSSDCCCVLSEF
jgi:uncharacterized membrane protein YfcA